MARSLILQGLVFLAFFTAWDFHIKEFFYSWITEQGGSVGLGEIALDYGIVFGLASITSRFLIHQLGLDREEKSFGVQS